VSAVEMCESREPLSAPQRPARSVVFCKMRDELSVVNGSSQSRRTCPRSPGCRSSAPACCRRRRGCPSQRCRTAPGIGRRESRLRPALSGASRQDRGVPEQGADQSLGMARQVADHRQRDRGPVRTIPIQWNPHRAHSRRSPQPVQAIRGGAGCAGRPPSPHATGIAMQTAASSGIAKPARAQNSRRRMAGVASGTSRYRGWDHPTAPCRRGTQALATASCEFRPTSESLTNSTSSN
jgi:hypothetical protein